MSRIGTTRELIKALRDALEGARDLLGTMDPEATDDYQDLGAEITSALIVADRDPAERRINDWRKVPRDWSAGGEKPIDWETFKKVWAG